MEAMIARKTNGGDDTGNQGRAIVSRSFRRGNVGCLRRRLGSWFNTGVTHRRHPEKNDAQGNLKRFSGPQRRRARRWDNR